MKKIIIKEYICLITPLKIKCIGFVTVYDRSVNIYSHLCMQWRPITSGMSLKLCDSVLSISCIFSFIFHSYYQYEEFPVL